MDNEALKTFLHSLKPPQPAEKRIALFHCPTFNLDSFNIEVLKNRGYYAYPPRGLQCLATIADEMGYRTDIVDLNFLILEQLMERGGTADEDIFKLLISLVDEYLLQHPDVWIYGVSTGVIVSNIFSLPRHPYLSVLSHLMRIPEKLVLTGGAVATIEYRSILRHNHAHIVLKGEAEDRLAYLLTQLDDSLPPRESTSGICFLSKGAVQESSGSSEMVDFQQSVISTYDQIPIEKYHTVGCLSPFSRLVGTEKPYASLLLNRGCRMRCSFCGLTQYRGSNKVCKYPVDTLLEELRFLVNVRGIRHFEWLDEDLLADRSTILEVMNRITEERLPITWAANIGVIAVYLDEEILDAMARSHCIGFRIGVESGNVEMLKKIRKPLTIPKLQKVCERLQHYPDLFVASCWILGFPEERYSQMFDTLKLALDLNLSWAQITIYQDLQESEDDSAAIASEGFDHSAREKRGTDNGDFIPSVEKVIGSSRKDETHERALQATEIFQLPPDSEHDPRLKDQIWFAFNLIINYVANKNLRPGGNIEHFSRWLRGLQMTYPQHALMSLFQSFACRIRGATGEAETEHLRTVSLLRESIYWRQKFDLFHLMPLIEQKPQNRNEICAALDDILDSYGLPFERLLHT